MLERKKLVISKAQIAELKRKSPKLTTVIGSIFGEDSKKEANYNRKAVKTLVEIERERVNTGMPPWPISDGAIDTYLRGAHEKAVDLYLLEKIQEAKKRGEKFKVLDVGIGNGNAWRDFFEKHNLKNGVDVDVFGTTLVRKSVTPTAKLHFHNRLRTTNAGNLANKFSDHTASFDLILSRIATYNEPLAFIENAHALLKPGGELLSDLRNTDERRAKLTPYFESKHYNRMHLIKK